MARVTVMKKEHTCLNGVEWLAAATQGNNMGGGHMGNGMNTMNGMGTVEIRQDEEGNIVGGARVLGPIETRPRNDIGHNSGIIPVLPKVQRNSASRLPFLMQILPQLMNITKETTPVEIRDCLLKNYGAEVHLQQCRRAKTEILKKQAAGGEEDVGGGLGDIGVGQHQQQQQHAQEQDMRDAQGMDVMGRMGQMISSSRCLGIWRRLRARIPLRFMLRRVLSHLWFRAGQWRR